MSAVSAPVSARLPGWGPAAVGVVALLMAASVVVVVWSALEFADLRAAGQGAGPDGDGGWAFAAELGFALVVVVAAARRMRASRRRRGALVVGVLAGALILVSSVGTLLIGVPDGSSAGPWIAYGLVPVVVLLTGEVVRGTSKRVRDSRWAVARTAVLVGEQERLAVDWKRFQQVLGEEGRALFWAASANIFADHTVLTAVPMSGPSGGRMGPAREFRVEGLAAGQVWLAVDAQGRVVDRCSDDRRWAAEEVEH